jgi:glyoxylase-like metal-dependent hydrolase (beta-lactamase superfamily II)
MLIQQSFTYEEVLGFKLGYAPFGKPSMFSHCYFVDGLLIDTGHHRARKALHQISQSLSIEQIFVTHHHEDHTGNLALLQDQFDCPAYSSEQCATLMKNPPVLTFAQWMVWGSRKAHPSLQPKQGIIQTPQFTFEIIPIPGHAKDMVALYERKRQWLFSADLYIHTYISYFTADENIEEQIQSIRSILELDFKVLFCGHSPQLKDAKKQLSNKLFFLENFYQEVHQLHQKGYTEKEIFRQMHLKENWYVKILSGGYLSKMNMVRSVLQSLG